MTIASPGQRLGAWILDALIGGLVIATPVLLILGYPSSPGPHAVDFIVAVIALGCLVAFDGGPRGATPGKRIIGTRVVDAASGEGPIGYSRAVARRLGYIVGWMVLLIGWLWLIWDSRHQAWHDKFADTVVVTTR